MGLERRGNKTYYYRKQRVGKRVVSEYVGGGDLARMAARLDSQEREARELERNRLQSLQAEIMAEDKALAELEEAASTLMQGYLLTQGYHTHKGQWRRKRENKQT